MSKEFGNHLRNMRKEKGYTQLDMANMLNISRSTYTYYEIGKSEPDFDNLRNLASILKVDYNTILNYKK